MRPDADTFLGKISLDVLLFNPTKQDLHTGSFRPDNVIRKIYFFVFSKLIHFDVYLLHSVATALPTITAELGGGRDYSWVGR